MNFLSINTALRLIDCLGSSYKSGIWFFSQLPICIPKTYFANTNMLPWQSSFSSLHPFSLRMNRIAFQRFADKVFPQTLGRGRCIVWYREERVMKDRELFSLKCENLEAFDDHRISLSVSWFDWSVFFSHPSFSGRSTTLSPFSTFFSQCCVGIDCYASFMESLGSTSSLVWSLYILHLSISSRSQSLLVTSFWSPRATVSISEGESAVWSLAPLNQCDLLLETEFDRYR